MSCLRTVAPAVVLAVMATAGGRGLARDRPLALDRPPLDRQFLIHRQAVPTKDLLSRYAAGEYDVFKHLPDPFILSEILLDLKATVSTWLASKDFKSGTARRVIAAFALEAVDAGLLLQSRSALDLLDWAREKLIVPHRPADDFDRVWFHLVIALLENLRYPEGVEQVTTVALRQFPGEPRFVLARAWVEEQKLVKELKAGHKLNASKLADVFARLNEAMALPEVRGEAALRVGRVEMSTQRHDAALLHLDQAGPDLREPDMRYLQQLFRGRALAQLGRPQDAVTAYQAALDVRPGAQSATIGLAELAFLQGERDRADTLVAELITRDPIQLDPWWTYELGDARMADQLLAVMRAGLK